MTGRSVRSNSSPCGKQRYRFGGLVVQKGVFCGICLHWFHYSCAGTTERYVNNIPREEHFVCPTCLNQPSGLTQAMSDLTLRPDTTKEDMNPWTFRDLPPYQHINDGNLKTTRGMNLPHDELVECFTQSENCDKIYLPYPLAMPGTNSSQSWCAYCIPLTAMCQVLKVLFLRLP